jgi:2'-5' RNA ligase
MIVSNAKWRSTRASRASKFYPHITSMRVKIIKSPDRKKKFRAVLEDGRTVDFGASGYSDYTKHKNPSRMRSYVLRHGGRVPKRTIAETRIQYGFIK